MFIHYNEKLTNSDDIDWVDFSNLVEKGYIRIYHKDGEYDIVEGPQAFDVIMRLSPAALEGKRAKYHRHAWAVHNIIGHPLMQIFSWLGFPQIGLAIHDKTVPNPMTKSAS